MNQNNEVPTKLHAKLITVATIGAVGGFLFGYDTSVINGAVDAIASPDSGFGLNAAMSGFSVSSAMIGCVVGAWFAGTLADRIGRVRVMQLAAALFVFSALFTGLASNIWVFVIFRIVGGLGVGFTSAIGPAYISETPGRAGSRQAHWEEPSSVRTSSTEPWSVSGSSFMTAKMRSAPARAARRKFPCWVNWLMGRADWRTKTR